MGNLSVRPSARSVKNARRCRVCLRTAGGGLEYAFPGNWSAKFEGAFYDLGTITTSGVASPHIDNFVEGKAFKVEGAVARVGVNWRFGGLGWYGL